MSNADIRNRVFVGHVREQVFKNCQGLPWHHTLGYPANAVRSEATTRVSRKNRRVVLASGADFGEVMPVLSPSAGVRAFVEPRTALCETRKAAAPRDVRRFATAERRSPSSLRSVRSTNALLIGPLVEKRRFAPGRDRNVRYPIHKPPSTPMDHADHTHQQPSLTAASLHDAAEWFA